MKGKVLFCVLFTAFLALALRQFGHLSAAQACQSLPERAVAAVTLPGGEASAPQRHETPRPLPIPMAHMPCAPLCSRNGLPVRNLCFYRAAYNAFCLGDSAG